MSFLKNEEKRRKRYTVTFTPQETRDMEILIRDKGFSSKADLIRSAVRDYVRNQSKEIELSDDAIKKIKELINNS